MKSPNQTYLKSRVDSATPAGLVILLYEGLIRFASDAHECLAATPPNQPGAANAVKRSIDILTALNASLDHGVAPELCSRLSGLYSFFTEELHGAIYTHDPARIAKILPLIEDLYSAWREADQSNIPPGAVPNPVIPPAP